MISIKSLILHLLSTVMKYYIPYNTLSRSLVIFKTDEIVTELAQCNAAIVGSDTAPEDLSSVPKIIFFTTEVVPLCRDWVGELNQITKKFNAPAERLYFVAGGTELDWHGNPMLCPTGNERVFLFNYFFYQVAINNRHDGINFDHTSPRAKIFDCLLGSRKPHRIFIYNRLIESGLLERSIVNLNEGSPWEKHYFNTDAHQRVLEGPGFTGVDNLPVYSSPELKHWEIPAVHDFKKNTNNKFYSASRLLTQVNEYDESPQVSALVPKEIYNNSHYSIVAETGGNLSIFMSEKIAKPVFGRRVFVLFGSAGLLQHFRDQGFKTFGDVIDESYDLEPDDFKRFTLAWAQCVRLSSLDPKLVYAQLDSVLTHNRLHLLDINTKLLELKNFIEKVVTG